MQQPFAHVSLVARLPIPGASKTRLAPALGFEGAAQLARTMGEHVALQLRILTASGEVSVDARVEGSLDACREWLRLPALPQGDGDLGARIKSALAAACAQAPVGAVAGGDCPTLDAAGMHDCLRAAAATGASIVPAIDGGFLMLAVDAAASEHLAEIFGDVEWSTARVCDQVVEGFRRAGISPCVLESRPDIDLPQDLPSWEAVRRAWYDPPQTLGVVIPALDEAEHLPHLLALVLSEADAVVVADGGSHDGTTELAREAGARVLRSPKGRAIQMNAGAAALDCDALLFLHADSTPRAGFRQAALDLLADPSVALGAYRFSLEASSPVLRLIETGTNLRASRMSLPYGDQGLFLRTVMFRALEGFAEVPVLEDLLLVERAAKVGRIAISSHELVTSDRRWREVGPWRWTALNVATLARHRVGATPADLAEWRRGYLKR